MFVTFVGANRIQDSYAQNADYSAENIRLLEIEFNQFFRAPLNEINRPRDVY
jgi:hypothetical protein